MQITLQNGLQLRSDLILRLVIRSDMSPVPATVELDARVDDSINAQFAEGKTITVNSDEFTIMKSESLASRVSQGDHLRDVKRVTCFLSACMLVAHPLGKAIIKENCLLTEIFKASGATIRPVSNDFHADRFYALKGDAPSFAITRLLQEEGGIIRWKNGRIEYFRVNDLFDQRPVMILPDNATENVQSSYKQQHEIPTYYSLDVYGATVIGDGTKCRSMMFVPNKNQLQLYNMSRCLVRKKVSKINYTESLCAGDIIGYQGAGPLVIVTAAHVFTGNADGGGSSQFTKLWLSAVGAG